MVLEIEMFRTPEGIAIVKESQRRRYKDLGLVDKVVEYDTAWRKALFKYEKLNMMKNLISKTVGGKMKAKEPVGDSAEVPDSIKSQLAELNSDLLQPLTVTQLKAVKELIDSDMEASKKEQLELDEQRLTHLRLIGNIVHDSVVVHNDEDHNGIVKTWGECTEKKYSHRDLIEMIDGVDMKQGTVAAGNRGYYLKGPAVMLEFALAQFGMQLLVGKDYVPIIPPFFMRKEVMAEVAQLAQFDEELYKVTSRASENEADTATDEKYLIATAEQPLCALNRDTWVPADTLPVRYAGWSSCFRQEVGSHGRDTAGIFRVHQFEKLEQFVMVNPSGDESWQEHERMVANAEEFYQALGIPYRIVNIVSGALNDAAAKKLDIEGWFPGSKAYRELVSASNCTDYQSRRLKIRFGTSKDPKAKSQDYVHMLNATMCAITRVICVILELNQTEEGITVPEALRPYMPLKWKEFIPFVKPAPVDETAAKKK